MTTRTMQISKFKARCIETLREIDRTRKSVLVTLRGKPIAIVEPIEAEKVLGGLRGECKIHVDLVHADFAEEWEAGAQRKARR